MHTIGILLPRSTYYGGIGFEMFEGLRAGLKRAGRDDIRIVAENIGFGTDKQECYRLAERLIIQENVSVVFAYLGHRTAQLSRPLFMAANRLLVVLDAGAHLPQEWPSSPNIFYHSLNNSLGIWLNAHAAIRDGYRQAGVTSCFYDGGYLQMVAAANGFVSGGGEIVYNHITGYTPEDFVLSPLKKYTESFSEACLLPVFSGEYAEWFFRDLVNEKLNIKQTIYPAPFTLEESVLGRSKFPKNHIKGIVAWSMNLSNTENLIFCDSIREAGREATLFSLLGWEAAILAIEGCRLMQVNNNNGALSSKGLSSFVFESPRGKISYHEKWNHSLCGMHEVVIEEDENGFSKLRPVGEIENCDSAFEALVAVPLEKAVSGWFNSYTCI